MVAKAEKLWKKIASHPQSLRFSDFCLLIEWFGFEHKGGKGSHRTYWHEHSKEILNIQSVGGEAKPYQVRQLLQLVKTYDLKGKKDV